MAFMLWLSADEESILERIMREEGTYSKQQAVIAAIRDKGAKLATEFHAGSAAIDGIDDRDGGVRRAVVEVP